MRIKHPDGVSARIARDSTAGPESVIHLEITGPKVKGQKANRLLAIQRFGRNLDRHAKAARVCYSLEAG